MLKDFLQTLIIVLFSTLLTSLVCLVLFKSPIFTTTPIFFYRGLKIICLSGMIGALLTLLFTSRICKIDIKDLLIALTVPTLIWVLFFTHIPVTGERSVSVFLLGYMRDNQERLLSKDELQQQLASIYINEFDATDKRLQEQIYTGTIAKEGETYRITSKGLSLLRIYDTVAYAFNINHQLLHPCQFSKQCQRT